MLKLLVDCLSRFVFWGHTRTTKDHFQGKKGISLRLNYVQIIDPVGTSSGGGNPFGTVEGGFVKSDAPAAPTQAAPAATAGDDDDFDF